MNPDSQAQTNYNKGRWTPDEKKKFDEALNLFGKDWAKIHKYISTRTLIQVRSHAQKYFRRSEKPIEPQLPRLLRPKGSEDTFEAYALTLEASKKLMQEMTHYKDVYVQHSMMTGPVFDYYPEIMLPQKKTGHESCVSVLNKKVKLDYCE